MNSSFRLGVDIGGTKIAAALVGVDGAVARRDQRHTPAADGGPAVLEAALSLGRSVAERFEDRLAGVGVGAGGQIDADSGRVVSATGILPGWAGIEIGAAFRTAFPGITVAVDNDVNALAEGEWRFGAAAGYVIVVFLALGTGVGGALLLDGRPYHGARWTGAEFGHLLLAIDPNARLDAGGRPGTLEAYASGPGLLRTWRQITGEEEPSITGVDIAVDAARDPGGAGALAVARTGEYLGYGLVSLANCLDPHLIVIGGGLASLGDRLLDPARRILRDRALPGPSTCPVVPAALGPDAAVIGAACLAMP
ncbi:MAG: ROK family protein [Capsulimonadaceae bacterium]